MTHLLLVDDAVGTGTVVVEVVVVDVGAVVAVLVPLLLCVLILLGCPLKNMCLLKGLKL